MLRHIWKGLQAAYGLYGFIAFSVSVLAMNIPETVATIPNWGRVVLIFVALIGFMVFAAWLGMALAVRKLNPKDEEGQMPAEEWRALSKAFRSKCGDKCPICGGSDWNPGNHNLRIPIHHHGAKAPHALWHSPAFPVFCDSCGFISLHNPDSLRNEVETKIND